MLNFSVNNVVIIIKNYLTHWPYGLEIPKAATTVILHPLLPEECSVHPRNPKLKHRGLYFLPPTLTR